MPTDILNKAGDFLVTQGWAGIFVLALCFALWRQSKWVTTLTDKLETAYTKQTEIQEKRVTDAITMVAASKDMSSSMDRLADLIQDRKSAG